MSQDQPPVQLSTQPPEGPGVEAMSREIKDLVAALAKAVLKFGPIAKSKVANIRPREKQAYSYSYADLADVLDVVRKPLADEGLVVVHTIDEDKVLTGWLLHISGQWLRSRIELGSFNTPQALGSDITYMRRYTLSGLIGVASEEDDDAGATDADKTATPKGAKAAAAKPSDQAPPKKAPARKQAAAKKKAAAQPAPEDDKTLAKTSPIARKALWATVRASGKLLGLDSKGSEKELRNQMQQRFQIESTNDLEPVQLSELIEYFKSLEKSNREPTDAELAPKEGEQQELSPEDAAEQAKADVFN